MPSEHLRSDFLTLVLVFKALNASKRLFIPRIRIYDSWEDNYNACQAAQSITTTPYAAVLAVSLFSISNPPLTIILNALVPLIQLLSEASGGIIPEMNAEWSIEADSVPAQTNGVDCGFFTIMFILHLLYFDHLNAADCPSGRRISGGTKMAAT
ncbi:hypothetical protein B0H16DRAFT_92240 [Mycena metata]|uniref:Uncharacterized protein n=1 Tax=Mycena metata TaxID=1033252 RepID=A0AAD7MZ54_9AGAR|nr:hypothetical protein B0H16DRAFT_92240 [Mycena metata]